MKIEIRYSVEQEFEEAALVFARRLFAVFDEEIESLALVPSEDEDLTVYLNDYRVFSFRETGRLPRLTDVAPNR